MQALTHHHLGHRSTPVLRQRTVVTRAQSVTITFREDGVTTEAAPGANLVEVAAAAGVTIPTGCHQGNCGVCEVRVRREKRAGRGRVGVAMSLRTNAHRVEVYKYTGDAEQDKAAGSSPAVVRACITGVPPGYSRIEVAQMDDAIWGVDGFDT